MRKAVSGIPKVMRVKTKIFGWLGICIKHDIESYAIFALATRKTPLNTTFSYQRRPKAKTKLQLNFNASKDSGEDLSISLKTFN